MSNHSPESSLEARLNSREVPSSCWSEPTQFNLGDEASRKELEGLLESNPSITVVDNVIEIASELYEMTHPDQKDSTHKRDEYVAAILAQRENYGTWVHFPWNDTIVRYPGKQDHQALRTVRNRNLITAENQEKLLGASIAVFGLSVGSNVLERLVQSGIGGQLTIADMDVISPSNLNRINGTYLDVGEAKVDVAAKKISQIDPYVKQVHFRDGVNDARLEQMTGENKPDIIIDEVDDLTIKAKLRLFAQEHGIPLIMATDLGDKSIIDVERYDQGGTKPFNGKIKREDVERLAEGSVDKPETVKLMMKIVGVHNASPKMLQSFMEVGKTLPGIPQLGATAATGGSLASVTVREILLGRKMNAGRYIHSPKRILNLAPEMGKISTLNVLSDLIKSSRQ